MSGAGPSRDHDIQFDLRREAQYDDNGYDSTNEDDEDTKDSRRARHDLAHKQKIDPRSKAKAGKEVFREETSVNARREGYQMASLNAYDRHKQLVNTYQLYYPGATGNNLQRDTRNDKRDIDVIKEHHRFVWNEKDDDSSWEVQLAKRYYDKLVKEYCIADVSRYKENKIGLRWRTEQEVVKGKGQFMCGAKKCEESNNLRTWEVNFGYLEQGEKKNVLIKVRMCFECSYKLNYHHKKKEVTKSKKKKSKKKRRRSSDSSDEESSKKRQVREEKKLLKETEATEAAIEKQASNIWSAPQEKEEEKTRTDVFSEFLEDLFL